MEPFHPLNTPNQDFFTCLNLVLAGFLLKPSDLMAQVDSRASHIALEYSSMCTLLQSTVGAFGMIPSLCYTYIYGSYAPALLHAHRWVSGAVLAHSKSIFSGLQRKWLLWASKAPSALSGWSWSPAKTQPKSTRHCQSLWWRRWSCEDTLLCLLAASTALWDGRTDGQMDRQTDGWTSDCSAQTSPARAADVAFCCCCCSKRNLTVSSWSGQVWQETSLCEQRVLRLLLHQGRSGRTGPGLSCSPRSCFIWAPGTDWLTFVLPLGGELFVWRPSRIVASTSL